MAHFRLLYIWDGDARGFFGGRVLERLPIADYNIRVRGGRLDLVEKLDGLVAKGHTFSEAILMSHGAAGQVNFGNSVISYIGSPEFFGHYEYSRLFPGPATIYLDGCNAAADDEGTRLLKQFGNTFLRHCGGVVVGYTSKVLANTGPITPLLEQGFGVSRRLRGRGLPMWPGKNIKKVLIRPGGVADTVWEESPLSVLSDLF